MAPRVVIEHRLGVQAPAHEIWKIIGDLPSWKDWNPLYTSVEGSLGFGAPLTLTVNIPGRKPEVIVPIVESWTPDELIHWRLKAAGGLLKTIRYIEIEKLTDTGCIFSNGEIFEGFAARFIGKRLVGQIKSGFRAMGEAVKERAEAAWQASDSAPYFCNVMIDDLYSARILTLAANLPRAGRLAKPDASAEKVAKLCGSKIVVDVVMDGTKVADFAQEVKACALGQAAASVLGEHVIGADVSEIETARDQFRAMLKEGAPAPDGRFSDLKMLEPVRDYPPRHASTLLAFEATAEACRRAIEARSSTPTSRAGAA